MTGTLKIIDLWAVLAIALLIALTFSVYFHNRRSRVNRLLALFLFNVTIWFAMSFVYYMFYTILPGMLIAQSAVGIFMGPSFYFFSRAMADDNSRMRPSEWAILVVSAGIALWFLVTGFHPVLFAEFSSQVSFVGGRVHRPGDFPYLAYSVCLIVCFIMAYAVLWRALRGEMDPRRRRRICHVLIAALTGQIATLVFSNLFAILGIGQLGYLNFVFILAGLVWISVSIIRDRLWTVEHLLDDLQKSEKALSTRSRIIEGDLELARLVQRRLLPEGLPSVKGLDVRAVYLPVEKVGGDYYDYRESDGSLDIIIADVSGHGIASAFLSSIIKMGFHFHGSLPGPDLLLALDGLVNDMGARTMFVTSAFCRINLKEMEISCCRAGHCPPLVVRRSSGNISGLAPRGRALGMNLGPANYETIRLPLEDGDRIFLYTDGVIEARNPRGEYYGEERLIGFLRNEITLPLSVFCEKLLEDIEEFSAGFPRSDDITFIVIEAIK